jgi:hypothetical protein
MGATNWITIVVTRSNTRALASIIIILNLTIYNIRAIHLTNALSHAIKIH